MTRQILAVLSLACLLFAGVAAAQEAPAGFRGEVLADLAALEKKLVGLAEVTPQEKYSWRPGPGVRSISEVFMHVAGANFFIPGAIGVKPPAGLTRDIEKTVTEKAKVIETLKQSFAHVRQAITDTPDADLDKSIKLFGRPSTTRAAISAMATHTHEHLGQSIAYARTNGVKPPWSEN